MTQPYPLTGTLLTPSTRKRLPQRLRSNALVSTNGSLPASRVLGTDPLGAHLDYDRIADQPSRIIDETNCESCNGSSFAESRSNEGTQSWSPKDTTDVYTYTVRPEAPASGCKMGNSSHRFLDLFAIGSSEDRRIPEARIKSKLPIEIVVENDARHHTSVRKPRTHATSSSTCFSKNWLSCGGKGWSCSVSSWRRRSRPSLAHFSGACGYVKSGVVAARRADVLGYPASGVGRRSVCTHG